MPAPRDAAAGQSNHALEVLGGDDPDAFAALVEPHRRELRVHCYRMLGSFDEAEDQVQETFLQAWRRRETYQGHAGLRPWLYRIATNACLQHLRRQPRPAAQVAVADERGPSCAQLPWLQPFPDSLLQRAGPFEDEPEAVAVARETVTLAYLAAIQVLPPRQRAVLLLRDVLAFSAVETAEVLGMTVAAVTSSLQRARASLGSYRRATPAPTRADQATAEQRTLLQLYMRAHETADPAAIVAVLREDARLTISPIGMTWDGREEIRGPFERNMGFLGTWRCLPTAANGQPAAGMYLRAWGEEVFRAWSLVVLQLQDGGIADIATFAGSGLFPAFELPMELA